LIQTHASQLMAFGVENLQMNFGNCLGIIDHRTQNLSSLSRLRGRLDLLVNQIKQNSGIDEEVNTENLLVYQEDNDLQSMVDESSESSDDSHHSFDDDSDDEEEKEDNSMQNGTNSDGSLGNTNGGPESSGNEDEDDEEMDMSE
jgi:hypothetical protein